MMIYFVLISAIFLTLSNQAMSNNNKPHIIFIMADDLGWNDVGFHGSAEIPTPNIDALAYSGLILNNYYVTPICTPSRSALMTGKYPIHTGMQHGVLYGAEPRGLPLSEKLLPEFLRDLGYVNRIVGKWHLGSYRKEYTPLFRGFSSHFGYWTGHHDYFDHSAVENPGWGLDMRRDLDVDYRSHGQYSTDLFTREATKIIDEHDVSNVSRPLFLYLAHAAVHSGNPYEPLRAPDETMKKFLHIGNYERRRFASMMSKLDDSVGQVVNALRERKMLENSIIIFTTDNGGPAAGFNLNAASNFPLKGVKNTLWEGGIRGVGLVWSPLVQKHSRIASQLFHISDWLPTLVNLANRNNTNQIDYGAIDGLDLWSSLSDDLKSPRRQILHNIDVIYGNAALTVDGWKIMTGTTYNGTWDHWYGPSGRNYTYDIDLVVQSLTGRALASLNRSLVPSQIEQLRHAATIQCHNDMPITSCEPLEAACLFDIDADPCERNNLAKKFPDKLSKLQRTLDALNATAVPPSNKPLDPRGDPKLWNYVWTNFGDFINHTDSFIVQL